MGTNLSTLTPIVQATQTATGALAGVANAAGALSGLIVASPQTTIGYQPQNPNQANGQIVPQGPSFVFHYEGEQSVTLESDITDHYIENNSPIQDHWALRPPIIETHGFIGELNNVIPASLVVSQKLANVLTVVDAYVPQLSATALIAYLEAFALYQTAVNAANSAVAAFSSITGAAGESVINGTTIQILNSQTKQAQAFQTWWGYWKNRTLFTVQTPWAVFQNVGILRVKPVQDETTKTVTDFNVVFKLFNFAQTSVSLLTSLGAANNYAQPNINNGVAATGPATSFSSALGVSFNLTGAM